MDVRRFSTHDGRGIRTTIFLKGCSLNCAWCQNPETINPRIRPVFFPSRCIDCGLCLAPEFGSAVQRRVDGGVRVDITNREADWDGLVQVCPTGAIRFDAERYTVAQLVEMAKRDRPFYGAGGGVTISGGEPLFLPHFARELLRALKAEGIDTAVETALNVRPEFLFGVLGWADHVFADCKLIDPDAHRRHIGHGNARILANLEGLLRCEHRSDVTVRTPMIPGITDGEDNIAGIARFISSIYPEVRYELLNYNPLAVAKYDVLPDRDYVFDKNENPGMFSAAEMDRLRQVARDNGVVNVVVE